MYHTHAVSVINVKLSLCLIKRRAMKTYGRMEVRVHAPAALRGDCVGQRVGLGAVAKRKLCSCRE
jgi:hypothetical protein